MLAYVGQQVLVRLPWLMWYVAPWRVPQAVETWSVHAPQPVVQPMVQHTT